MSNPYLDIHTHRRASDEESVSVKCLSALELSREETLPLTSAGIHPWWIEDHTPGEITEFKNHLLNLVSSKKLLAIGETGIDRAYPEFLEQQKELFKWHLEVANENSLPLVIHSVRAGADFLQIIKEVPPKTPWIFHDFRGNDQLMKDLLRLHPKCYFSFGLSVDNSPQVRELMPLIPLDHLFLETDAQKHLDIHDIYLRAAECLGVDLEFLKAQLWLNFRKIRGTH